MAKQLFATVPANFEEFRATPEQFIDAGDHVVVIGIFHDKAKSGATVDAPFVHVQRIWNVTKFEKYVEASASAKAWV